MGKARFRRKALGTLLVVALMGALVSWSTFSAFSSTTASSGNSFEAGTVHISDNDAGTALYNVLNAAPSTARTRCIKVTYSGSLDSDVRLYATSTINSVGQYIDLRITPGAGNAADCSDFNPDGASLFNGTVSGFASAHDTYGNGLVDYPNSTTKWTTNDSVTYEFKVTLQDDNNANGGAAGKLSTGSHAFTWEAHNQ